jgi:transcriptional regulator with XRE-family HTH domain
VPLDRRELGARLRQLRQEAGLTGEQLAGFLGVDQSTVSRLETGRSLPRVDQIEAWARATNPSPKTATELLELLENVATEAASWRMLQRSGLRTKQDNIHDLEAQAHTIHIFTPVCVPGIMQIAEYARMLLGFINPLGQTDIGEAVTARLQRQTLLYDETKHFEVVVTESALRWRPGSVQVQRAQLAHLISLASLPNVELGVIPLDIQSDVPYMHLFVVHELQDETVVTLETLTAELQVRDSRDVATYQDYLNRARSLAVWADEAISFIRVIRV